MKYDTAKLPMWARTRIAQLERELAASKAELAGYLDGQTESKISVPGLDVDHPFFIQSTRIRFHCPSGWIDANIYNGQLKIRASESLIVIPCCSNVIEVVNRK